MYKSVRNNLTVQCFSPKHNSKCFTILSSEANMTITSIIILALFTTNITNGNLELGNLVNQALENGILMSIIVHQYPMDYVSEFNEVQSSKRNQEGYERKKIDSRVRLVRKRNFKNQIYYHQCGYECNGH